MIFLFFFTRTPALVSPPRLRSSAVSALGRRPPARRRSGHLRRRGLHRRSPPPPQVIFSFSLLEWPAFTSPTRLRRLRSSSPANALSSTSDQIVVAVAVVVVAGHPRLLDSSYIMRLRPRLHPTHAPPPILDLRSPRRRRPCCRNTTEILVAAVAGSYVGSRIYREMDVGDGCRLLRWWSEEPKKSFNGVDAGGRGAAGAWRL